MFASTAGSNTAVSYQGCSFYLRVQSLTVQHYQCLVDRGWRRLTCCKHYTIRLNADSFKPSRDQRQCLHKWTRNVLGEEYIRQSARRYPQTKEEKKKKNEFDLLESIHAPEFATLEAQGHIPPEPAHKFEVTLECASFSEEKYDLFNNYQQNVHHEEPEEISRGGFTRFLCRSPLCTETTSSGKKLGSWHQCYRLNGRLIALVGVYFIYHSDFDKWHLGKISACREACLAKEGGYQYYYMGYYIPSCQKMRYKGEYGPQEFLSPGNNEWIPLDDEIKKQLLENPASAVTFNEDKDDDETKKQLVENPASAATSNEDEDNNEDEYDDKDPEPGFCIRSRMPGLMTADELETFSLGDVRIGLKDGGGSLWWLQLSVLRTVIEETVAVVGPDVASEMIMMF
ncbi:arginine-tRNA-protein transferase [Trichophaea hybrida]|nr:arginine-tRNA-protein transferase [Trichophaea hybrida]KAF8542493.1 arginine-tRNA-protein transferase [Trichophaea hybrida]